MGLASVPSTSPETSVPHCGANLDRSQISLVSTVMELLVLVQGCPGNHFNTIMVMTHAPQL